MAIDTSIYNHLLRPPKSIAELDAEAEQVKHAKNQNRLTELVYGEKQRGIERANRLQSMLANIAPGASVEDQVGELTRGGYLTEARTLAESGAKVARDQREGEKAQREAEKFQLDATRQKIAIGAQILGSAKDQASYDFARQSAIDAGLDVSRMPPQFDPAFVQARLSEALTAQERLEQEWKKKGYDLDVGKAAEQERHNRVSEGLTARGQDKADARAKEANLIAQGQKGVAASTGLRKEFDDLPEVKNYKQALPAFSAIKDAVTRNTTQADINIVYGLAKLYDPTSVVREGEYATVANSPNIPERIKGYAQYLANGGRLTDKVKQEIMAEANGRMKAYEEPYTSARLNYTTISQNSGADPKLVFPSEHKSPTAAASIPPGAAAMLKSNPKLRDHFDAKYGSGAAASILGK